ncbi:MAG: SLC13 family permease [Polyangiaceae bacterium]
MLDPSVIVLATLAITVALFVSDRLPLDLVSLMALATLMLSGVLTPAEALAGFSNPIVLMIAGLFVVGAGLQNAGVTVWLGEQLTRLGGSTEGRLLVVIMGASAIASSFMSSTGTVAILMPVVVSMARRLGIAPGRLLIPLAFSSLLGGMLTLIGTPPNIVVNDELRRNGVEVFGFFSYTPPGLVLAVVGIAFLATAGRRLLPGGKEQKAATPESITQPELAALYGLSSHLASVVVPDGSPLVGQTLAEANLRKDRKVTVLGVRRGAGPHAGEAQRVVPTLELAAGDQLRMLCHDGCDLDELVADAALERRRDDGDLMLPPEETMAEIVLPRRSSFVGKTLRDVAFRTRHRSTVLAIQRGGATVPGRASDVVMQVGDTLLVKGPIKSIDLLEKSPRDFVVLTETRPARAGLDPRRAAAPLVITALMLALMTLQLVPNVLAVMLAGVGMVLSRTLTTVEVYRRINWESVIVVAAILPMATALDKTGSLKVVVGGLVSGLGDAGPLALMAALFVVTSIASQVISNTATTVLVAPVAYQVATRVGVAPQPLLMAVALAASTAFATPIASPVNMLVLNAGGYRFADFAKVGIPLQLVLFAVTLAVVPLLFPF